MKVISECSHLNLHRAQSFQRDRPANLGLPFLSLITQQRQIKTYELSGKPHYLFCWMAKMAVFPLQQHCGVTRTMQLSNNSAGKESRPHLTQRGSAI